MESRNSSRKSVNIPLSTYYLPIKKSRSNNKHSNKQKNLQLNYSTSNICNNEESSQFENTRSKSVYRNSFAAESIREHSVLPNLISHELK